MRSLKRTFVGLLVSIIVFCTLIWLNFDAIRYSTIVWISTPEKPFAEAKAFDYKSNDGWITRPASDASEGPPVDVFLVHPTTYFRLYKDSWNQSADDADTRNFNKELFGAFRLYAGCCKAYIPHYRQATLGAFAHDNEDTRKALALAYADVERAFDNYIARFNNGRPFILAGASQGSRHIFMLLKNRISGTALKDRMVAAYPLIWWMKKEQFAKESPDIPVCGEPKQTGCVATFNPVGPHLRTGLNAVFDQTGIICVNPLTWRADGAYGGFELNLGVRRTAMPDRLIPAAADAQCDENGRLVVSEIRTNMYEGIPLPVQWIMNVFGRDNYHSIAGGLFYANIKHNAEERAQAFLAAHSLK